MLMSHVYLTVQISYLITNGNNQSSIAQPSDDDPPAPRGPPPPSFGPRGGFPPLPGLDIFQANFMRIA